MHTKQHANAWPLRCIARDSSTFVWADPEGNFYRQTVVCSKPQRIPHLILPADYNHDLFFQDQAPFEANHVAECRLVRTGPGTFQLSFPLCGGGNQPSRQGFAGQDRVSIPGFAGSNAPAEATQVEGDIPVPVESVHKVLDYLHTVPTSHVVQIAQIAQIALASQMLQTNSQEQTLGFIKDLSAIFENQVDKLAQLTKEQAEASRVLADSRMDVLKAQADSCLGQTDAQQKLASAITDHILRLPPVSEGELPGVIQCYLQAVTPFASQELSPYEKKPAPGTRPQQISLGDSTPDEKEGVQNPTSNNQIDSSRNDIKEQEENEQNTRFVGFKGIAEGLANITPKLKFGFTENKEDNECKEQEEKDQILKALVTDDWPLPIIHDPPRNSYDLAALIEKNPENTALKKRALRLITAFMSQSILNEENLKEVRVLVHSNDEDIIERLASAIGRRVGVSMDTLPRVLDTLDYFLIHAPKSHSDSILVTAILDSLLGRLSDLYSCEEDVIESVVGTLTRMMMHSLDLGIAGVPKSKFDEYRLTFDESWVERVWNKGKNLGDSLEDKSKEQYQDAKKAAFTEALKRLGSDDNVAVRGLGLARAFTFGLFHAARSILTLDLESTLGSFDSLYESFGSLNIEESWFEVYSTFRLFLLQKVEFARKFWDIVIVKSLFSLNEHMCFLIIELLYEAFTGAYDGEKRKEVVFLLCHIQSHESWPNTKTLQFHTDSFTQKMISYVPPMLEPTSWKLFEASVKDGNTIEQVASNIKEAAATQNDVLDVYIPIYATEQGKHGQQTESTEAVSSIHAFISATNTTQRLLVITGEAGAGKTMLLQHTANHLWGKYKTGNAIPPIYASIQSLKTPRENLVSQLLKTPYKNGQKQNRDVCFTDDQASLMQSESWPLVFFVDDFDELDHTAIFSLMKTELEDWPSAKFVITSRYALLNEQTNLCRFAAVANEVTLLAFQSHQRQAFFDEYAKKQQSVEWASGTIFEQHLGKYPAFAELSLRPLFASFIASILPKLVNDEDASSSNAGEQIAASSLESRLSVALLDLWIAREEQRIHTRRAPLPQDFPRHFGTHLRRFCKDIALLMQSRSATESEPHLLYEWDAFERKSSAPDLDRFFAPTSPSVDFVRRAAPITKASPSAFKFLSKVFYDYFVSL